MKRCSLVVAVLAVLGFNTQIAAAQTATNFGSNGTGSSYTGGYVGGYNPNGTSTSSGTGYQPSFGGPAGALASGSAFPYRNSIIGGPGSAQYNTQHVGQSASSQAVAGSTSGAEKSKKAVAPPLNVAPSLGTLLSGVGVALSGNTFILKGQTLLLSGVSAPPAAQVCGDNGQSYHCGENAEAILADILSQGPVRCYVDGVGEPLPVRCTILGESVNQAVLYQGR